MKNEQGKEKASDIAARITVDFKLLLETLRVRYDDSFDVNQEISKIDKDALKLKEQTLVAYLMNNTKNLTGLNQRLRNWGLSVKCSDTVINKLLERKMEEINTALLDCMKEENIVENPATNEKQVAKILYDLIF